MNTILRHILIFASILYFFSSFSIASQKPSELNSLEQKSKYFLQLATNIEKHKDEFISILSEIGAPYGAAYEVQQAIDVLRGAPIKEISNISDVHQLNKIAIYGSSNIPLYTLAMQVFIPSVSFKNVVFKMSSKSKSVYQKLWAKLQVINNSDYDFSNIKLISGNSQGGNTDQLLQEILGQSSDHILADMVVFTGNPANGDQLKNQIFEELKKVSVKDHKTVFLKFGAGMNPIVIDQSASFEQIKLGARASIEHFKINSGQDCISPNFTLIPVQAQAEVSRIVKLDTQKLIFGSLQDPSADYSSLTFGTQKNIQELADFKSKYSRFLITNTSAIIDPISKRVDPHVFIFPGSMYKELPLNEFFAPFSIFFTYENENELHKMIQDERLTKKAMFASLFGEEQSEKYKSTKRELIKSKHIILSNSSVFKTEDGNKPFGGFGSDVSTVDVITKSQNNVSESRSTRPILITKEIKRNYKNYKKAIEANQNPTNSVEETSKNKITFGIEIEINVSNNPKLVKYYRPAKFSEEEWLKLDYNHQLVAASEWESIIRKQYKVSAYERLSTAPHFLPQTLLSESNKFFEINGIIFESLADITKYVKNVKNLIGEGYVQGHVVFDHKRFNGYSGFYKFMSEYTMMQRLATEQQRYYASGKDLRFLPGANFSAHSLPPPSQVHYDYTRMIEKSILNNTFKGFESENEYLIFKHVSAPVVRSSNGFASTYGGTDTVGIEFRMADSPSDSALIGKQDEDLMNYIKILVNALEKNGDLSIFKEFDQLESFGKKSTHNQISEFIQNYKNYFSDSEIKDLNLNLISQILDKNGLIDHSIRSQNTHIDYGPLETGLRFLFPIKLWHKHPVLKNLPSENRQQVMQEYILATKNYIQKINSIAQLSHQNSHEITLKLLRESIGEWSWGVGQKKYSEMTTPWNTQIKVMKKNMETVQEPHYSKLKCVSLFN